MMNQDCAVVRVESQPGTRWLPLPRNSPYLFWFDVSFAATPPVAQGVMPSSLLVSGLAGDIVALGLIPGAPACKACAFRSFKSSPSPFLFLSSVHMSVFGPLFLVLQCPRVVPWGRPPARAQPVPMGWVGIARVWHSL